MGQGNGFGKHCVFFLSFENKRAMKTEKSPQVKIRTGIWELLHKQRNQFRLREEAAQRPLDTRTRRNYVKLFERTALSYS